MNAWNFLTVETARYCGKQCRPPAQLRWRAPLVALDVDGVLDRRLFGFPSTTAAGIEAISLLHAHEFSVALNTARSVAEVKDYCSAYSLAGGVAEHGSYIWDAVARRGRALVGAEAMCQLAELKAALQRIPGVFLDDRHEHSLRAFTYRDRSSGLMASLMDSMHSSSIGDGALAPLPSATVQHLLADLRLDRLGFEQTSIDTAIFAKEVDKGAGLLALRDWVLGGDAETVAIGDHEADLAMFRVATRSFAPSNIGCATKARLFGCRIARQTHQKGLLAIALAHRDGRRCERCAESEPGWVRSHDLFLQVLQAADRGWAANLLRALVDPAALRIFVR
jgi:hydroxymethylpyrimidine pyrophosphatase-like HAD family hydrolase